MTTRRALLGAAGLVCAGGVAGCSGVLSRGPPSVPDRPGPTYRSWIPSGRALPPGADAWAMRWVSVVDLSRLRSLADVLPADAYERLAATGRGNDAAGVDFGGVDVVARFAFAGVTVMEGTVDRSRSAMTLERGGYGHLGTHRGFDLFDRRVDGERRFVAVGDGAVAWKLPDDRFPDSVDGLSVLRRVLDARSGAVERAHERDPAFAAVTERLGRPLAFSHPIENFGGFRGYPRAGDGPAGDWLTAFSTSVEGETAYRQIVAAAPDAGSVDEAAFRAWVGGFDRDSAFLESPEFLVDGSLAVAVERRPATSLGEASETASAADVPVPPMATVECTYRNDTESRDVVVRIDHRAGDEVPIGRLRLSAGDDRNLDGGTLEPGGAIERTVPSVDVRPFLTYRSGDVSLFLDRCRGPAAR